MKSSYARKPLDQPPTPKRHQQRNGDFTTHSIFVNDTSLGPQEQGGVLPGQFYEEAPDILYMDKDNGKNSKSIKRNQAY